MDDSKSKNPGEVPEENGAQQTAEEISATVSDGTEAAAAAAEMIGEAERAAELEEMMDREFLSAEGDQAPEGDEGNGASDEAQNSSQNEGSVSEETGTGSDSAADGASGTGAKDSGQAVGNPGQGAQNTDSAGQNSPGTQEPEHGRQTAHEGFVQSSGELEPETVPVTEAEAAVPQDSPEEAAESAPAQTPAVRIVFPGEGRDLMTEYADLVHAHPELIGNGIPKDIYEEMKASERPVLSVYDACMLKKQTERISQLEAEIAQLRQNAETAARAPVVGAAGAPVSAEPEDEFLRGFNSYR